MAATSEVGTPHVFQILQRITIHDENDVPIFVGLPWQIVGVSSFYQDQILPPNCDVLWHNNTSNETQVWVTTRDEQRIASRETVQDENGQDIFVGPPWQIVATGYFSGLGPDL